MITNLIAAVAMIALVAYIGVIIVRLARRLNYERMQRRQPIISEWKARKNAAPLSNAFSRYTETPPGPVPVARDHRAASPDR